MHSDSRACAGDPFYQGGMGRRSPILKTSGIYPPFRAHCTRLYRHRYANPPHVSHLRLHFHSQRAISGYNPSEPSRAAWVAAECWRRACECTQGMQVCMLNVTLSLMSRLAVMEALMASDRHLPCALSFSMSMPPAHAATVPPFSGYACHRSWGSRQCAGTFA